MEEKNVLEDVARTMGSADVGAGVTSANGGAEVKNAGGGIVTHDSGAGEKRLPWWAWLIIAAVAVVVLAVAGVIIYNVVEDARVDAAAVTYKEDLTVKFGEEAKVSDFLANLNGELIEDVKVDTERLGETTVSFEYVNLRNKRRKREFVVTVTDETAPTIYGYKAYTVPVGYQGKLTDLMMSGDDLDNEPVREIVGEYDLDEEGSYEVEYVATDASGNVARWPFTLKVVKPVNEPYDPKELPKLPIGDVIAEHKTERTKIGIDVSSWQGEIDWKKVKQAGVEFAYIRIGYQLDYDTEYTMDKYFHENMKGALAAGLPVGVYFYTYANTVDEAKRQAEWIMEEVKDYEVELGIAFDWEDWADFNNAKMSFYTINQVARTFIDTVKERGYKGLLYSSKNYLEKIWEPREDEIVWLAQYYDKVTYDGKYYVWQMSDRGRVDGIYGDVDLDVMRLDNGLGDN